MKLITSIFFGWIALPLSVHGAEGLTYNSVSENQTKSFIKRNYYQIIIEKQFPGFHILQLEDFDESVRSDVRDGVSGALIIGNFDFDQYKDFAALLKGKIGNSSKSDTDRSNIVYDGMLVICHGNENNDSYACEELGKYHNFGFGYNTLSIIPPGLHECEFNEGAKNILTSIDGIGEYSDKAGGFMVRKKDGSYFRCADSD